MRGQAFIVRPRRWRRQRERRTTLRPRKHFRFLRRLPPRVHASLRICNTKPSRHGNRTTSAGRRGRDPH